MPVQRLQAFLDEHQVKYVVISHSRAFTTQEIAAATHAANLGGAAREGGPPSPTGGGPPR